MKPTLNRTDRSRNKALRLGAVFFLLVTLFVFTVLFSTLSFSLSDDSANASFSLDNSDYGQLNGNNNGSTSGSSVTSYVVCDSMYCNHFWGATFGSSGTFTLQGSLLTTVQAGGVKVRLSARISNKNGSSTMSFEAKKTNSSGSTITSGSGSGSETTYYSDWVQVPSDVTVIYLHWSYYGSTTDAGECKDFTLEFAYAEHTVTLNKQNGTGGTNSVTATYNSAMPAATMPTRDGFIFGGYYTSTGGSGTQYYTANGTSARNWDRGSNTTLYAKWSAITYTIAFNANGQAGASMPSSITVTGANATSALPSASCTGMRFAGWMYSANSSAPDVRAGGTFYPYERNGNKTANITITLYALWQAAEATGTGGLTFSVSPSAYVMYEDLTVTITSSKPGHTLVGVFATYTSGDLNTETIALEYLDTVNGQQRWKLYGICGNCNLKAEWQANTVSITYGYSTGNGDTYNGWASGDDAGIDGTKPATFVVGVGVPEPSMPRFTGKAGSLYHVRWRCRGDTISGGTYDLSYIPTDAVTATCISIQTSQSWRSLNTVTSGSAQSIDCTSNSGWAFITSYTYGHNMEKFHYGAGRPWGQETSYLGYSVRDKQDEYHIRYSMACPIYIYGDLRKRILSGEISITVSASCQLLASASRKQGSVKSDTYAYLSIWNDTTTSVSITKTSNNYSYSSITYNSTYQSNQVGIWGIKDTSWHNTGWVTATTGSLTINSSNFSNGFTIGMMVDFWNDGWANHGDHSIAMKDLTYTITITTNPTYKYTINANGGGSPTQGSATSATYTALNTNSVTTTSCPWIRDGYEFVGWSTSSSASSGSTSLTPATGAGNTYYAIWVLKKYPFITYDVFADGTIDNTGTSYATRIRKVRYVTQGSAEAFNGGDTSHTSYTNNATNRNTSYPYADNGDYRGFTTASNKTYWLSTKPSNSVSWAYVKDLSGKSATTSVAAGNVTHAIWGFYYWNMADPTATPITASVVYGTSVNLENQLTISHTAIPQDNPDPTFAVEHTDWRESNVAGTPLHTFYIANEPILYTVAESHEYSCTTTVSLVRIGVTLRRTIQPSGISVTINPIQLVLNNPTVASLPYTGVAQEFAFTTTVDTSQYAGAALTAAQNTFKTERNIPTNGVGGTGLPWYHSGSGSDASNWCGVAIDLTGVGYRNCIDATNHTAYYEPDAAQIKSFCDAGTYWVSVINIRQYVYGVSDINNLTVANSNYVWTVSKNLQGANKQTIEANSSNASGTATATITPASGFTLYALYTEKTFGSVNDPAQKGVNMDGDGYSAVSGHPNYSVYLQSDWYLAVDNMLLADYMEYVEYDEAHPTKYKLYQALDRDRTGLYNAAGYYDVFMTMSPETFPARLLNNYGCQVTSASYSTLSVSTITLYFLDASGNKMSNTGFNFTTAWNSYSQTHNNFRVLPRPVTMTYTGGNTFTYNRTAQGPTNVISNGLLDEASQNAFQFIPVANPVVGDIRTYYELVNSAYVPTEDVAINGNKTYYSRNYSYDNYFQVYFYGIPMPSDWSSKTDQQKDAYVTANMNSKVIVGSGARRYVDGIANNWIQFLETNAGKYGVLVVETAYSTDGGNTFYNNENYALSTLYYAFSWTINKATVEYVSAATSGTFGDINFGGTGFTFSGIEDGDAITCTVATTYSGGANNSSAGFIRYQGFTTGTQLVSGTPYRIYGTQVGTYTTTATYLSTVGSTASSGLYGTSYGHNYQFSGNGTYSNSLEVTYRTVSKTVTYTIDGGSNYVANKPAGTYDWTYNGVAKGVKVVISGFYESGFATSDISYRGGGKSEEELEKILIPSTTTIIDAVEVPGLLNTDSISIDTTPADLVPVDYTTSGTGSVTYVYTATNAGNYTFAINANSGINYVYKTVSYSAFHLDSAVNETYIITPKVLTLSWVRFDQVFSPVGNPQSNSYYERSNQGVFSVTTDQTVNGNKTYYTRVAINAANPTITYDGTAHYFVAALTSGATTGGDGKVYAADYSSASALYTTTPRNSLVNLTYASSSGTNAGGYDTVVTQLSGNYTISETQNSYTANTIHWTIARRSFSMTISANAGTSWVYDGTAKELDLSLVADSSDGKTVAVSISNFTTNVSGAAGVTFSMSAGLNINTAGARIYFYATDVGQYTFSYSAGNSGIDVETNWHLTGTASYSGNPYLFCICPKVYKFTWNTTSLVYNGSNRATQFVPTEDNHAVGTLTLTYGLSTITHAGNYTQSVATCTGDSNYVLANANLSGWFVSYNNNQRLAYYTTDCVANGNALSSYSHTVTITPKPITLTLDAIDDVIYDGTLHGVNLASVYESKAKSQLYEADRNSYTLLGVGGKHMDVGNYEVTVTGFARTDAAGYVDYSISGGSATVTWSITAREIGVKYVPYGINYVNQAGETFDNSKTYYTRDAEQLEYYESATVTTGAAVTPGTYYEWFDCVYSLSNDTSVNNAKDYYVAQYEVVASPVVNNLQAYYQYANSTYTLVDPLSHTFNAGNTYYTKKFVPLANPTGNPHNNNYYEYECGSYSLTEDTTFQAGHYYYIKDTVYTYTAVTGATAGNIANYYLPEDPTYDGNPHGYLFLMTDMVEGEYLALRMTTSGIVINNWRYTTYGYIKAYAGGATLMSGTDAGHYSISGMSISDMFNTIEGVEMVFHASNYNFQDTGIDIAWDIIRKIITVEWSNDALTYRASEYNPNNGGCYATVTNSVGGDVVTPTYGGQYAQIDAGTYTINIAGLSGGDYTNYQIVGSLTHSWTISPKTISLVTWAGEGFAGTSVTYDGDSHRVLATPTSGATAANDGKIYAADAAGFAFSYSSENPNVTSAIVYGTYQSEISGCNDSNYTVSSGIMTTWNITKRALTATVTYDGSTATHVYDASAHGATILISGFVAGDYSSNISFTYTAGSTTPGAATNPTVTSVSKAFTAINFGDYTVSVAIDNSAPRKDCYTLSGTTSGTFHITKRAVTLSWSLDSTVTFTKVYDGTAHIMTAAVTNLADANDEVDVVVSNDRLTNVGNQTATATSLSGAASANYTLTGGTNLSQAFSVTARPITASWNSADYTYNGQYQGNTLTVSNLVAGDSLKFTINFYTGGYSGTNIHTSEVTKTGSATATITAADCAATINGGTTYYAILSTTIKTGNAVNTNYTFTPEADSDRTTYTIARKTLTLSGSWTWTNGGNSGTYGNGTYLIYNKAAYTLTTAIGNGVAVTRVDTSAVDALTLTYSNNVSTNAIDDATAEVTGITGTYAGNYQLPASRSRVYTIHAKEVTIVWSNYTGIVYDGAEHTVTASIASGASNSTDGKLYAGDTVSVSTVTNATKINAGTYTATATALSSTNYVIGTGTYASGNASLEWTISARPVNLTWSITNVEYDGTEKSTLASASNLVSGDSLTFTYTNNAKTNKGDYTATVTAIGGTSAANYTLTGGTNISHTWHITPIVLNFSWTGGNNLVYNKTAQGVTLTIANVASGDLTTAKLSFTFSAGVTATHNAASRTVTFTAINAGNYTANVATITGTSATNYTLPDSTSTSFTISPRTITVSWTTNNVTYDHASHNAVASLTNLCAGDTVNFTYLTVGTGYNVSGAAGTGNVATHVNSYTTSITAVSNANYTISGATGISTDWSISAKNVTINWSNYTGFGYDGTSHAVTAGVTAGASAANDGYVYTGDTVNVSIQYKLAAAADNTYTSTAPTNAGSYTAKASIDNDDYTINTNLTQNFSIAQRTLTVTITNVTTTSYVYNGAEQGKRVTLGNIVAGDNDNTNLNITPTFAETVTTATRNGTTMYRDFLATDAGSYSGSAVLSGNRSGNYQLASAISVSFTITPKEINTAIVVNTTTNTFTYAARAITAADLGISFTTLVGGETLIAGTDFNVTYKDGSTPIAAPSNVKDTYKAVISLASTATANNYTLVGTTEFTFSIVPYVIDSSMITWKVGDDTVTLDGMVFSNSNKNLVALISDPVYGVNNNKTISYQYFGFCNGGINETYAEFSSDVEHATHQWLLDNGNLRTTGPIHAGTYWVVLTLSGGDAANFQFDSEYFTGYDDNTHFTTSAGNTYLTWYNDPTNYAISSALPVLGDTVACVTFGINRAALGAQAAATPSTLPYKGAYYHTGAHYKATGAFSATKTYYTGVFNVESSPSAEFLSTYYEYNSIDDIFELTEDNAVDGGKTYYTGRFTWVENPVAGDLNDYYEYYGLPYINAKASGAEIWVEIGAARYSYASYVSGNYVKNAGTYTIRIYDANAAGAGSITGCDFFSDGAVFESVTELTITKSKITVTDQRTDANAWQKKYDKTVDFPATVNAQTIYSYPTGVTFYDGVVTNGVISGTTVSISAAYNNYNSGARTLAFTLSGADASNYWITFATSENPVSDSNVTVVGNTYSLAGRINQRVITVVDSSATKVYDGTTSLVPFEIDSSDILPSDEGSVTVQGYFASANVGNNIGITITILNDTYNNYTLAGQQIAATGSITARPVTLTWTNTGNVTYDRAAHGVSVTVSNMVSGHEEPITVTGGGGISDTTIAAGTTSASYSATNAGTYSVSLTLGNNSNYTLNFSTGEPPQPNVTYQEWTIARKTLGISWTKDTLADGAYVYAWSDYSVVYSAVERSVTPSLTGVIAGDTVTFTSSQTAATNVGSYSSAITALTGAQAANYALPNTTAQAWSITAATIVGVTMSNVSGPYTAAPQGPEVNTYTTQHGISLTAVYSGGVNQTKNTLTGNNARTNVGASNISVTLSAANYTTLNLNATVTITKATVTGVLMSNVNTTYDTTTKSIAVNKLTTQYGESISVTYKYNTTGINDAYSTAFTGAVNAGTYYVQASCDPGSNYNEFTLKATLTIAKADIDEDRINVVTDSGTVTYNAAYHGVTITVTDNETQYGEPVTITYTGGQAGGTAKDVGVYNINAVVSAGSNYNDFTTESTTLTITPATLTVSYQTGTFTYNATTQTPTVTITSGICAADAGNVGLTVTVLGTSGEANGDSVFRDAGTYRLSVASNNSNYTVPAGADSSYKDYTVNKADITGYYFVGSSVAYNGELRYLGVNSVNNASMSNVTSVALIAPDTATVTYKYNTDNSGTYTDTFSGKKYAGTYYLQATINHNGNYKDGANATWVRTATLTITAINLSGYTFEDLVTTFDGSVKTLAATYDNALYYDSAYHTPQGDVLTLTYTISSDNGSNYVSGNSKTNVNIINSAVAPYKVHLAFAVSNEAAGSYVVGSMSKDADLTINKAVLAGISFGGGSVVYDGNSHNLTPSVATPGDGYPRYYLQENNTVLKVVLSAAHNSGNGDTFTVTQTVDEGVSAINVGSYHFRLGLTALSANPNNYETYAGLTSTVTITAATMSTNAGVALAQGTNIYFGIGTLTFSYDALTHYLIVASTSGASVLTTDSSQVVTSYTVYPSTNTSHSDTATIIYSVNSVATSGFKNVGVYNVSATLQNGNYNSVTLEKVVTIEQATINYGFVGTTLTYDTLTHYAAVTAKANQSDPTSYNDNGSVNQIDLCGSDKATVAYTYTSTRNGSGTFVGAVNADTYEITATITVSGGMGGNYATWETNNSKTIQLTISPYASAIVWTNDSTTFTYNGQNRGGIITAAFESAYQENGVHPTIAADVTYLGTSGRANEETTFKNAGTYTVTASYSSGNAVLSSNYTLSNTTLTKTIAKADVNYYLVNSSVAYNSTVRYLVVNNVSAGKVQASNVTSITPYDEVIPVVYTYAKAGGTYDSYFDGSQTVTLTLGAKNAGTYTVTANIDLSGLGGENSNYNAWNAAKSATLTIQTILLSQDGGNFDKEYDGDNTIPSIGNISGLVNGDTDHLDVGAVYNNKNVGNDKPVQFSLTVKSGHSDYAYLTANYVVPSGITGDITARALIRRDTLAFWTKAYDGTTSSAKNPLTLSSSESLTLEGNDVVCRYVSGDDLTINAVYNSKNVLQANSVSFTVTGADATNYSISSLNFAASVDFSTVYLITPLSAGINWSAKETNYNGTVQQISARIDVFGADAVGTDGTLSLTLALQRTHDGNGDPLSPAENNATYRNAGTYTATATSGEIDATFIANYGITSTSETGFVIHKATRVVSWSGLAAGYTYNGQNQGPSITVTVTLLGTDTSFSNYIRIAFTGQDTTFKDAGDYTLTAEFTGANADLLNNNYSLSNTVYYRTIQKADINNLAFSGSYEWTYYHGVTNYFFVVAANSNPAFARLSSGGNADTNIDPEDYLATDNRYGVGGAAPASYSFNYPFDNEAMPIVYSGGENSHANVTGLNGIKNVKIGGGSYTISASVAASANYNSWAGSITVTVHKGTIDNVVMGDVTDVYGAVEYHLYAYNGTVNDGSEGIDEFVEVTTPDGASVDVTYAISNSKYYWTAYNVLYSDDINYAVNAGIYSVSGFINGHRNYVNYTVPNVVSANNTGAVLNILQRISEVTWEYNNQATADFTYNATNQASTVRARIIRVENGAQNYYLSVAFQLQDAGNLAEALQHAFAVAGTYTATATVPTGADYNIIRNNYRIVADSTEVSYEDEDLTDEQLAQNEDTGIRRDDVSVSIEMKKYTVDIQWYYGNAESCQGEHSSYTDLYDPEHPCVYDAEYHGVSARGLGLGGSVMAIDTSGVFKAIHAGNYTATVDNIHEGTDTLVLGGNSYQLAYAMNYQLAHASLSWSIAQRPIYLTIDNSSHLSKIYDGSSAFDFGAPDVSTHVENDGTVTVTWTYTMTNEKEAEISQGVANTSVVIYSINNIISCDVSGISLPISEITAAIENVTAQSATIIFNAGALNSDYVCRSDLSGAIISNTVNLITPRPLELVFDENASHVYNGETFSLSFIYSDEVNAGMEGIFSLQNPTNHSPVSSLIGTNRIVGTANIGGETDADVYDITVNFTTQDVNTVTNYDLTVPAATYEIITRELVVNYTNILQSLQRNTDYATVGYNIDTVNSDLTDLDWEGMGNNPSTYLSSLLTSDSFAITIGTTWADSTYTTYTMIVGSADNNAPLRVTKSSDNYVINYPVLQITYLKISNASTYTFTIEDLDDLMHLDTDNAGLANAYEEYEVGVCPTYNQTADIDGLVNYGYTTLTAIRSLRGTYAGQNHSISHINVLPNGNEEEVGFFTKIVEGGVSNLKLYDIGVYSTGSATTIGGFAGQIEEGVSITDVTLYVNLLAYVDSNTTVSVGGFVGQSYGTLNTITVVGKADLYVDSFGALNYGGVIGYVADGTATTVKSFVDSSVISEVSLASNFCQGGVIGNMDAEWATDRATNLTTYSYLAYSNYAHDDVAVTHGSLRNSAFGNVAETTYGATFDTLYADVTIGAILDTYVIRSYFFKDGNDGTTSHPVEITNYRQLPLMIVYPYMAFRVTENVYSPIRWTTQKRGFYGTITYANGKVIKGYVPSDTDLFETIKSGTVCILKEGE